MNRLLSMSLFSSCLLILTGCNFHNDNKHKKNTVSNHAPTVIVSNNDDDKKDDKVDTDNTDNTDNDNGIVSCSPPLGPIKKFIRVQITYGLLDATPLLPFETGGTLPLKVTAAVSQGETVIPVDSTQSLVDQQLLTYLGTNGVYSVVKIRSTTSDTITLTKPLPYALAAGDDKLWNFYDDAAHPNNPGFKAWADYSFNSAFDILETNQVHALLGDSWFQRNGQSTFADRLLERLPSGSIIKNEGIGGNTLCDLYARVDGVINTHNPNVVWINSSINDFFDGVTQAEYKARMQALIYRVQTAGAIAVVMDPAPGLVNISTPDGRTFTTLSQRYAQQVLDLLAEAN